MRIPTVVSQRDTVVAKLWYQLGGSLVVAAFLPYCLRLWLEAGSPQLVNLGNSLIGTVVAASLAQIGFRQSIQYPGVRSTYGIVPSIAFAFGVVAVCFLFLRLDYSRLQFIFSFVFCIGWYFIVHRGLRSRRPRFAVVPFGEANQVFGIGAARWMKLDREMRSDQQYDAVVADLHADIPPEWERFLADAALAGVLVFHYKHVRESLTGRVEIEHLSENEFGSLIPGAAFVNFKRVLDVLASLALLIPLIILLLPVAILIKLDSPGPAFFTQRRVGYRGEIFTLYKLRTMKVRGVAADAGKLADAITTSNDVRITRLGAFLRKYRVDELPQLLNVLKGEMSWIGPRPEAVPLSEWYESELPFYRYRHIVRPGLTGWAQVNQGHVAEVSDVLWKLHYDFYYIRNFSFWLDLLIVGRTIRTVLSGFGSK